MSVLVVCLISVAFVWISPWFKSPKPVAVQTRSFNPVVTQQMIQQEVTRQLQVQDMPMRPALKTDKFDPHSQNFR